ncbi:MAG: heavy metal-binding domain-containing protein [Acidimicrobiales bacterium]
MTPPEDLPEAAPRRLESGSFSSGLTIPDFAACLQIGLRPVGLVQGFCVMRSSYFSPAYGPSFYARPNDGSYVKTWQCPHGFVSGEHRLWGQNYEQTWVEQTWLTGFSSAFGRLIEEARDTGAHGVIGVSDTSQQLADTGVIEFHILGTAVVVDGGPPPRDGEPWSTYLAGQRLVKLLEAGLFPVSVVAAIGSVRAWPYCMTEYLMGGSYFAWGGQTTSTQEVEQISDARLAARAIAREQARHQLHGDALQGISMATFDRELSSEHVFECVVRGTRVRTYKAFEPMATPAPKVRLS